MKLYGMANILLQGMGGADKGRCTKCFAGRSRGDY